VDEFLEEMQCITSSSGEPQKKFSSFLYKRLVYCFKNPLAVKGIKKYYKKGKFSKIL